MTVTAPPRPPRPSDPMDREEIEALVEALIEEARQRARRRRRRNGAVVTLVALVGVALFASPDAARSHSRRPRGVRAGEPCRADGDVEDRLIREPSTAATAAFSGS